MVDVLERNAFPCAGPCARSAILTRSVFGASAFDEMG
jgi:hypothetical protein